MANANDAESRTHEVETLVVGAGFGGLYSIYKLRQLGKPFHVFEASPSLGGVWLYNAYPGARVDSEWPVYQLSIPEVYRSFEFTERFSDQAELCSYFEHVDKVLNVRKDITFNAEVTMTEWNNDASTWTVKTKQGHTAVCKYLILCTGSTYKRYIPDWPGLRSFKGEMYHTAQFTGKHLDMANKKVAVIGQGATGVQVVQALAKQAGSLTVFLRTPNIALPMAQRKLDKLEQQGWKSGYATLFKAAKMTGTGFLYQPPPEPDSTVIPLSEREKYFDELYDRGGFNLVASVWADNAFNPVANRVIYDYWARKTRSRITDPTKRDLLAPLEPPHPWMGKRPSLEQDYYECMDRENVKIVNLQSTDIESFNEHGIKTQDGTQHDFDVIVLATGFDNYTGAFHTMGLKNKDNGKDLADLWRDGVRTCCGLMTDGYPNMWMVYGAQAPTAIGNGPMIIEVQIDIIIDMIKKMDADGVDAIEPTPEATDLWTKDIHDVGNMTLMKTANSWYMGANIPGKKREMLNYLKGLNVYENECRATFEGEKGWQGYNVVKKGAAAAS